MVFAQVVTDGYLVLHQPRTGAHEGRVAMAFEEKLQKLSTAKPAQLGVHYIVLKTKERLGILLVY